MTRTAERLCWIFLACLLASALLLANHPLALLPFFASVAGLAAVLRWTFRR